MLPNLPLLFINRMLRDETWACRRLRAHAGQTARLMIGGVTMRFTIDAEGLLQAASADAGDDVTVSLPQAAIGAILDNPAEITRHAHIDGSAALADTLATLLQHLRPDLAGWLAPFVGDVTAVRATRVAVGITHTGVNIARQGEAAFTGLLQNHLKIAVPGGEFNSWKAEVERLGRDLETLEARLRR